MRHEVLSSKWTEWCSQLRRRGSAARPLDHRHRHNRSARERGLRSRTGAWRRQGSKRCSPVARSENRKRRRKRVTVLPRTIADHIAGTAHGVQKRLRKTFVDLGPQPRNMYVDHIGLRIEMVVPDVLKKHGSGNDLAGMPHQIFEQAEFARLQLQLLAGAADLVRKPIQFEIADTIDGFLAALSRPARKRLDARQ